MRKLEDLAHSVRSTYLSMENMPTRLMLLGQVTDTSIRLRIIMRQYNRFYEHGLKLRHDKLSKEDWIESFTMLIERLGSWIPKMIDYIDYSAISSLYPIFMALHAHPGAISKQQFETLKSVLGPSLTHKSLHMIYPDDFPILDINVSRALNELFSADVRRETGYNGFVEQVQLFKKIVEGHPLTIREVEFWLYYEGSLLSKGRKNA